MCDIRFRDPKPKSKLKPVQTLALIKSPDFYSYPHKSTDLAHIRNKALELFRRNILSEDYFSVNRNKLLSTDNIYSYDQVPVLILSDYNILNGKLERFYRDFSAVDDIAPSTAVFNCSYFILLDTQTAEIYKLKNYLDISSGKDVGSNIDYVRTPAEVREIYANLYSKYKNKDLWDEKDIKFKEAHYILDLNNESYEACINLCKIKYNRHLKSVTSNLYLNNISNLLYCFEKLCAQDKNLLFGESLSEKEKWLLDFKIGYLIDDTEELVNKDICKYIIDKLECRINILTKAVSDKYFRLKLNRIKAKLDMHKLNVERLHNISLNPYYGLFGKVEADKNISN